MFLTILKAFIFLRFRIIWFDQTCYYMEISIEFLRFWAVFGPSRWDLLQVLNFCYKVRRNDFHILSMYGIILLVFRGLP